MNRRYFLKVMTGVTLSGLLFLPHALADDTETDVVSGATMPDPPDDIVNNFGEFNIEGLLSFQKEMIEKDSDKPVHIERAVDPFHTGYSIMKQLSPVLHNDLSVLIKPNIGGFAWFKEGVDDGIRGRVTDVRFVEGVVEYLSRQGVGQILIAEGWGISNPNDFQKLFEKAGYQRILKKYTNTRLIDLNYYNGKGPNDQETVPICMEMPEAAEIKTGLVVPKIYLDHIVSGLVINVPKLKTHRFPFISAGMKNLMGVIGFSGEGLCHRKKWKMHAELGPYLKRWKKLETHERRKTYFHILKKFSDRLCDIYDALHPHMTVIDGGLAAEGDGFNRLSSVPLCTAIGSYNTVFADLIAARMTGYWNNKVLEKQTGYHGPPYLLAAGKKYYQGIDLHKHVKVVGSGEKNTENMQLELYGLSAVTVPGTSKAVLRGGDTVVAGYLGSAKPDFRKEMLKWNVDHTLWIMSDWKGRPLPPGVATGFRCSYTQEALFVFFVAFYRTIDEKKYSGLVHEVVDLFKHDVVEIFIDPGPDSPQTYYEYEFSPAGDTLDLAINLDQRKYDTQWDSGYTGMSHIHEDRNLWYAAIRLPFGKAGKPKKGDIWKANFFRVEGTGKGRLYMAWQPTGTKRPKFHLPEKFGKLIFA